MTVPGTTSQLAGLWPLFGLLIETPCLQLRLPREDELPALVEAARDIAGPDGSRLQKPWMYGASPGRERQLLQRHWRALAHWKPASWHLPLAVFLAAEPVGVQDLWAEEFAQRRSVGTGSWVTRTRQGLGYGTEARRGPGPGLRPPGRTRGADRVHRGQPRVRTGPRNLGYVPNGQRAAHRDDAGPVTEYQLRLDRPAWENHARPGRVTATGLGPCLPLFGLPGSGDPE